MKMILAAVIFVHSWYPMECCHDQHCHPVPCETIRENSLGLIWNGIVFTEPMIRESPDRDCHVCVGASGRYIYPYCVFIHKPKPM